MISSLATVGILPSDLKNSGVGSCSVRLQLRNISSLLPSDTTLGRRINKAFSGAHLSPNSRLTNYFRWIDRADLSSLYTPAFQAALFDDFTDDPFVTYLESLPANMDPIERMLSLEKRFFLADHNLIYTDKMSAGRWR